MSYDPKVPEELKVLQTWFAGVITQPINHKSQISPISPAGNAIEEEAQVYIKPSSTLKPEQRIQIYNQQYWWRLLSVMHSIFILATRMLGYRKFNDTIAVPYLDAFPSDNYSVSHIGDHLHDWMNNSYNGNDKQLLSDAVAIDHAMNLAFFESHYPAVTQDTTPEKAFSLNASLQPHITLLKMDYDLFHFRNEIKTKDPDYWSSHHFPTLEHALSENSAHFPELKRDKIYYFMVYRSRLNHVTWEELSEEEFHLLSLFKKEFSIEKACEWLSEDGSQYLEKATPHLQEWIQGWIAKEFLCIPTQQD